jgi:hypothetical protein
VPAVWADAGTLVVEDNRQHSETLWSREGLQRPLAGPRPDGFADGAVWGLRGSEMLLRPASGAPQRSQVAALDIHSGASRGIPLADCNHPRARQLDGGLSSDGQLAYCLSEAADTLNTFDTRTGVRLESLAVKPAQAATARAPGVHLSAIGLTGNGHPLAGYRTGILSWADGGIEASATIRIPNEGHLEAVAGIPGTALIAASYDGGQQANDQRLAVIDSRSGKTVFEQPVGGDNGCKLIATRDGRRLAAMSDRRLSLIRIDGTTVKPVASFGLDMPFSFEAAAFDPAGTTLAVGTPGKLTLFAIGEAASP